MGAKEYASFFETISKTTPIDEYKIYFDENAKFKDPFHEVVGVENIYEIFQKMYKNLDDPKFKIDEIVEGKTSTYIRWYFSFRFKSENIAQRFYGVSRVVFKNKKVISHEDYWDSAEHIYEKIPFISWVIKLVKNKIKA